MDPLSAGMFASIGSAFKFADIAVRIAEVGSENAVFVRTIHVVRSDLEEVERLLTLESVQKKLTATPGKLPWIRFAIHNARYALNEVGKWVERVRVEQESTGSIKFDTRVRWVFNDHEKLLNRKTELSTCHQQLSIILGYLIGLEVAPAHQVLQEYEDTTYFDDTLARHKRTSRPIAPNTQSETTLTAAADPVSSPIHTLPPIPGDQSPLNVQAANAYEGRPSQRLLLSPYTLSPPESPPPTYATAVSIDPLTRPSLYSPPITNRPATASPVTDLKDTMNSPNNETWAYRNNLNGIASLELAGDAVIFSATNIAGPVNPYELCASPGKVASNKSSCSQRPCDSVSEMLGDLHFPVELPSNDPGLPPGSPPQLRATSDQVRMSRMSHTKLRNRNMPKTPPVVHRRPLPTNALSDSSLTVHELPPSLAPRNPPLPVPSAVCSSNTHPLATESFPEALYQSNDYQQPHYSAHQSRRNMQAPTNRHYSASAPPAPLSQIGYAAAFPVDSTSSWSLDTQPKAPKIPRAQEPAVATRMQSQRQIMDLLGSIGT